MYYSHDGGETYKDVSQLSTPPGSGGYWGNPIAEAALKDGTPVPRLSFNWNQLWGGSCFLSIFLFGPLATFLRYSPAL
jgi:oligoxyloglucan reducing-end-specific cellobiohydrolase